MTDQERIHLLEYKVQALAQQLNDFMTIVHGVVGHEHYDALQARVREICGIGALGDAHQRQMRSFADLKPLPQAMFPSDLPQIIG